MTRRTTSPDTLCSASRHAPRHLGLFRWLRRCLNRQRQRRALAELDAHLLRDVGLTREQAEAEANKPFWKA